MATRTVITYDCDGCSKERDCETHTLSIDGKAVEVDGCAQCWEKFMKVAGPWLAAGEPVKIDQKSGKARGRRRRTRP